MEEVTQSIDNKFQPSTSPYSPKSGTKLPKDMDLQNTSSLAFQGLHFEVLDCPQAGRMVLQRLTQAQPLCVVQSHTAHYHLY